ncbi:hypothetical protein GCM10009601_62270 [Streptomyces thermospinosisporus]|uniref:Uncharacterized protein n=1 Tax=Streptomyces thermospinosisporus TaxID=161482 RepID=A0ABP4K158_9ACTN
MHHTLLAGAGTQAGLWTAGPGCRGVPGGAVDDHFAVRLTGALTGRPHGDDVPEDSSEGYERR